MREWELVIGLEVHAQLSTRTKLFSRESTAFGAEPNTQVNEVCAGMPGALPVLNREAVELAMRAGYAFGCEVHLRSQFERKNYFYPDLPKGYQITQFRHPICTGGEIAFPVGSETHRCGISRVQLEEDAGKSIHRGCFSLVNLNRAGIPLIEIVGKPELRSSEHASAYLKELRNLLRYLDICDGNMEQGSLRCDANVSVHWRGTPLGTRVELKNINSFRYVQKAIDYEAGRQVELLEAGQEVIQETRLYNAETGRTLGMRSKEEAHDYRYFPDPDLPPLVIDTEWAARVRSSIPELPDAKRRRYVEVLGLAQPVAAALVADVAVCRFFEAAQSAYPRAPAVLANWILNDLPRVTCDPEQDIDASRVTPERLAQLVQMIDEGGVTGRIAKTLFEKMLQTGKAPQAIADEEGLRPARDPEELKRLLRAILDESPSLVAQYRAGKTKILDLFLGQVMKQTRGQADPRLAREILLALLAE